MAKRDSKQPFRQRTKPKVGRFIRPEAELDAWAIEEAGRRGMKNMQELLLRLLWEERNRIQAQTMVRPSDFVPDQPQGGCVNNGD
ncbi:MAG TPA: hypothetical protein VLZ81_08385 [Blastocatellia bacterium]|nr:hypothetical protein [Blastocatellia bacterium]